MTKERPDPSALGLFGLAIVTLVASSQKLGITEGVLGVVPWAIVLGGLAQLIAGILDYKKCNVFGATAFCGYGLFWLAVAMTWLINPDSGTKPAQIGFAFVGYLIFTVFMTIGAMETNKVLFFIFLLIDLLFLGLSLSSFGIAYPFTSKLAAISELLIALLSFYASGANVLNNHFKRSFLPIGKPFGVFVKH